MEFVESGFNVAPADVLDGINRPLAHTGRHQFSKTPLKQPIALPVSACDQ